MDNVYAQLAAPFSADKVSWRVGSTTKDKSKGLALAYIDARDVMERLDAAVGPENWQDRYEVHGGKTICYISICQRAFAPGCRDGSATFPESVIEFLRSSWVTKADGAGDSDIEAEKGALSDAFKRAAVKWGIGRYLYDVESPWVELELAKDKEGQPLKDKNGNPIVRGIKNSELVRLAALLDGKKPQQPQTPSLDQTPKVDPLEVKARDKIDAVMTTLSPMEPFDILAWLQSNPDELAALKWVKRNYPKLAAEVEGLGVEL